MSGRLRVVVDRDLCETNGVCVAKAPGVFEVGDDDRLHVLSEHPTPDQLEGVLAAVRTCPKAALSLAED